MRNSRLYNTFIWNVNVERIQRTKITLSKLICNMQNQALYSYNNSMLPFTRKITTER